MEWDRAAWFGRSREPESRRARCSSARAGCFTPEAVRDEIFAYMASLVKDEQQVAGYFRDAVSANVDFGSRGRGDEREDSDVELIVVEAEPFAPGRSRRKELVRLYHALAGLRVPADLLVFSHDDVDYWGDSLNHVLARALRERKVLYERRRVREDDASRNQRRH